MLTGNLIVTPFDSGFCDLLERYEAIMAHAARFLFPTVFKQCSRCQW